MTYHSDTATTSAAKTHMHLSVADKYSFAALRSSRKCVSPVSFHSHFGFTYNFKNPQRDTARQKHTHTTHPARLTRSLKEPLVSCDPLGASFLDEVQHCPQAEGSVGRDNLQLCHHLLEDLSRVEGEGVLGQTDFLVSMAQLDLERKGGRGGGEEGGEGGREGGRSRKQDRGGQ